MLVVIVVMWCPVDIYCALTCLECFHDVVSILCLDMMCPVDIYCALTCFECFHHC